MTGLCTCRNPLYISENKLAGGVSFNGSHTSTPAVFWSSISAPTEALVLAWTLVLAQAQAPTLIINSTKKLYQQLIKLY